eukprot:1188830-Rhodomonas_salina.1
MGGGVVRSSVGTFPLPGERVCEGALHGLAVEVINREETRQCTGFKRGRKAMGHTDEVHTLESGQLYSRTMYDH